MFTLLSTVFLFSFFCPAVFRGWVILYHPGNGLSTTFFKKYKNKKPHAKRLKNQAKSGCYLRGAQTATGLYTAFCPSPHEKPFKIHKNSQLNRLFWYSKLSHQLFSICISTGCAHTIPEQAFIIRPASHMIRRPATPPSNAPASWFNSDMIGSRATWSSQCAPIRKKRNTTANKIPEPNVRITIVARYDPR